VKPQSPSSFDLEAPPAATSTGASTGTPTGKK
jgi:hypothetical protein